MAFLSFHLDYYSKELEQLENSAVTEASIYHAKQLLKILDDLLDEGYTELNCVLEKEMHGVTRLQKYLSDNGAKAFPVSVIPESGVRYGNEEYELTSAIDKLMAMAKSVPKSTQSDFETKLMNFCNWIGYDANTAYIFLLRDTLLPYVYYKSRGRENLYPWLLGRKAMVKIMGKENTDDEIRAFLIDALESKNAKDFDAFCAAVLPGIKEFLKKYPTVTETIGESLSKITAQKIIVVESGCSGTFPMLLKAMDERVEIRMYTTYPYLLDVYGERIFTPAYEDNRLFETMYAQDKYYCFSNLTDEGYYVKQCEDKHVERKAIDEVRAFLSVPE